MNKKRITVEMIVEFIVSILLIIFFFIPWIGDESAARLFPDVKEALSYLSIIGVGKEATAYVLLLLYLIPIFAAVTIVLFAVQRGKNERALFLTTCIISTVEIVILLIVYMRLKSDSGALGSALIGYFARLAAGFWLTFILAVGGIVFAVIMGQLAKKSNRYTPVERGAGSAGDSRLPARYVLAVILGEYMGANIPVPEDGIVIGRDPAAASLVLSGRDISRKHCYVGYNASRTGVSVVDYSSIGTYTDNNNRLIKGMKYDVFPGQKLYLGSKKQVFEVRQA